MLNRNFIGTPLSEKGRSGYASAPLLSGGYATLDVALISSVTNRERIAIEGTVLRFWTPTC
jgi:hypothetical protein